MSQAEAGEFSSLDNFFINKFSHFSHLPNDELIKVTFLQGITVMTDLGEGCRYIALIRQKNRKGILFKYGFRF